MTEPSGQRRKAAIAFILVTLFIDILGIGIIIPVLPDLVKELVGDSAVASDVISRGADGSAESIVAPVAEDDSRSFSRAGRYVGVIGATYALMQFLFAPIVGGLSDRFGRGPVVSSKG